MILITGGAGFIGQHLTNHLVAAGHAVRVIDDLSNSNHPPPGVEFVHGSILNRPLLRDAMAGVTGVVHLAALASVPACESDVETAISTNVLGTRLVLEAAAGARVVFASSASIYPDSPVPASERTLPAAAGVYAATKLLGEGMLREYHNGVALRLFNVFHERDGNGVIAKWARAAAAGKPLYLLGDGRQTRDYVHVRDAARVITRALTDARMPPLVNVCTGTSTTLRDLLAYYPTAMVHQHPAPSVDVQHSVGDPTLLHAHCMFNPTTVREALS